MDLQIADSPTDLTLPRITSGLPEPSRDLILEGDKRGHATRAALAQIVLTGSGQREPNALPPISVADGESVHVPSPAIPSGNQGADYLPVPLSDQEGSGRLGDQALDVIEAVGRARVLTASLRP
jgi:hypothetical protein